MTAEKTPAIELRGLTKRFGGVCANDGVELRIESGVIHGVVGENGAGKTTAMKILYGIYQPDAGEILVRGQQCHWRSPSDAIAQGIGMVHQHFMLVDPFSALDNVILGAEPLRRHIIDRQAARAALETLARQYGLPVDWDATVEELPIGIKQRIEILKLLFRQAQILILDEPTSVLTPQETATLFQNLTKLRAQGKTIILITHKLNEVMTITDRVTVFRAGKVVGECNTSQTNPQELAGLMVGRKVALSISVAQGKPRPEPALEADDLCLDGPAGSRHKLSKVTFTVRRGEIVGIAGVEGNGQSELLEALLHPTERRCRSSGQVRILGKDVSGWDAASIRNLGVAVIPEDRHLQGLLLERPVRENFLLGLQRSPAFSRAGILNLEKLDEATSRAIETCDVRPRDHLAAASSLSGGNQQKLIAAREFARQPRVVIAAQPTRGVDVGAIEFIHRRIVQARDEGAGVLLVSSELEEILSLSDRILVLYEGAIVATFNRGQATEQELGLKLGGVS